ncbi:unnamed protein product [Sphagnum balticum]|jgi:hypothetical protein
MEIRPKSPKRLIDVLNELEEGETDVELVQIARLALRRRILEDNPDLSPELVDNILQSLDELDRKHISEYFPD